MNYDLNEIVEQREAIRQNNKTIILTNGCFDILHKGHVSYLNEAKKHADYLWVLLNSDNSVKKLKGDNRPINNQNDRKYVLENIKAVDKVIVFNQLSCSFWIDLIQPDFYCKASDYNIKNINKEQLKALQYHNIAIMFIDFIYGYSTTKIIQKNY